MMQYVPEVVSPRMIRKRVYLAYMTLDVYKLNQTKWKQDLSNELAKHGITATWVTDLGCGFVSNSNIRKSYGTLDSFELKSMEEMCKEIQVLDKPNVDLLFHTSSEIKGLGDQMIFWR